jgi:hypothetical protein
MYYVNVITTLTGKYAVHMVNENVLAFLWVVLLGIEGSGKMSDKRHTEARTLFTRRSRTQTARTQCPCIEEAQIRISTWMRG